MDAGGVSVHNDVDRLDAGAMLVLDTGAVCVLLFLMSSFAVLIAVKTTISFLTTPVMAWLIHRAMTSAAIPTGQRIGRALERYSKTCIWLLALFALAYLYLLAA